MVEHAIHSWVEQETSAETWLARAALFELASMGLLPIVQEVADVLVSGDYAAACTETAEAAGCTTAPNVSLLGGYEQSAAEDVFHELRRERTRLFVGERKPLITPYAGVRFDQAKGKRGVLMVGEESMAIERFMHRCGAKKDLAAGQSNDPIDHIGTLCEFMQYLCLVAAQAVSVPAGAQASAADAAEFHDKHFASYASWCVEQLQVEARTPFYQFLPTLLSCLL